MTVITISGLPGSGSTTVSKILAQKLNFNHFSPGRVFKDIAKGTIHKEYYFSLLQSKCNQHQLTIPQFNSHNDSNGTTDLWNTPFGKSKKLHQTIDEIQLELAKKGKIILDGKLSLKMIPNADLKIWLTANLETRASRTAQRDEITFQEASKIIKERENLEVNEWKKIYDFNYLEQKSLADLIIDTSFLSPEQVSEKIIKLL